MRVVVCCFLILLIPTLSKKPPNFIVACNIKHNTTSLAIAFNNLSLFLHEQIFFCCCIFILTKNRYLILLFCSLAKIKDVFSISIRIRRCQRYESRIKYRYFMHANNKTSFIPFFFYFAFSLRYLHIIDYLLTDCYFILFKEMLVMIFLFLLSHNKSTAAYLFQESKIKKKKNLILISFFFVEN